MLNQNRKKSKENERILKTKKKGNQEKKLYKNKKTEKKLKIATL